MTNSPPSSDSRFARAEAILGEYLEQQELGDAPPFASLLAAHPDIADELRQLGEGLPALSQGFDAEAERAAAEREEVERLLSTLAAPGAFQDRYVLESEVGQGGMGIVYRVRDRKLDRPLALKVIRGKASAIPTGQTPAIAPRQLVRFLNEAKITGQLDHPGIVPVHEVGVDEQGRAYFTMKLVKGRTLADVLKLRAAGDEHWTLPRTLGVIQRVCEAVAFAHERSVIHRDLKPANVMVGDFGEVYVMDWGLARRTSDGAEHAAREIETAIEEELAPEATLTRDGDQVGTPAYMSPEQAHGKLDEMGPWSDVYSIGAMLYELIAGTPPYVKKGESTSGAMILTRVVAGPPRDLVSPRTPPELIAICQKAMARDRSSRYGHVRELAEDLERFLSGRTVRAFRTGAWIETRKWVGRNKPLAGSFAAGVLIAIGGLTWVSLERSRAANAMSLKNMELAASAARLAATTSEALQNLFLAQENERRANGVMEFVTGALAQADPNQGGSQGCLVVDAMDDAIRKLDGGTMDDDPKTRAILLQTISRILDGNGRSEDALRLANEAMACQRRISQGDSAATAQSLNQIGIILDSLGRYAESQESYQSAVEMYTRLGGPQSLEAARCAASMANSLAQQDRAQEAVPLLELAVESLRRAGAPEDDIARVVNDLAHALKKAGRYTEAITQYEVALKTLTQLHGEGSPVVASTMTNLAACLDASGRSGEALEQNDQAIGILQRVFPKGNNALATAISNSGTYLIALHRPEEALKRQSEVLEMYQGLYPSGHVDIAKTLNIMGGCLESLGRNAEAMMRFEDALRMRNELVDGWDSEKARLLSNIAIQHCYLGELEESVPIFEKAIVVFEGLPTPDPVAHANALTSLGVCVGQLGRHEYALELHNRAAVILDGLFDSAHPALANNVNNRALCLENLGCSDQALEMHMACLAMRRKLYPAGSDEVAVSLNNIGHSLTVQGRHDEALSNYMLALEELDRISSINSSARVVILTNVANGLCSLHREAEALAYSERSVQLARSALPDGHPFRAMSFQTHAKISAILVKTR